MATIKMEGTTTTIKKEPGIGSGLANQVKLTLMRAWTERWSEVQWGVHLKRILATNSNEGVDLAEILLQQALVGSSPNSLVLSYLKHIVLSQVIPHSTVFKHISTYDDISKPYCIIALIDIAETFSTKLSFSYGTDSSIQMCKSLLMLVHWLLNNILKCLQKIQDGKSTPEYVSITDRASSAVLKTLEKQTVCTLLQIARAEVTDNYRDFEQAEVNVRGTLSQLSQSQNALPATTKDKVSEMLGSLSRLQDMNLPSDNDDDGPKLQLCSTINTLVSLEAVLNSTNELQPFVDQTMVIARLLFFQKLSWPQLYVELFRACFMGIIDAPANSPEDLKWTSFTFLKIPQILQRLQQNAAGRDVMADLEQSFELLINSTNLLDLADQKKKCDSIEQLLQGCIKADLLKDVHSQRIMQRREKERGRLLDKTESSQGVPCSSIVILRAEVTVSSILKTLDTDFQKNQEPLFSLLCKMMSGKSFEIILAAAASMGELKNLAIKLIKLNEFARHSAGEAGKASQTRARLFDITFLMLCPILQQYGLETITNGHKETVDSFFVQWAQRWFPEDGKYKNIENCNPSDSNKVESLINLFLSSGELKTSLTRWHEVCLNTPFAIQEILFAWEHGAIGPEQVKTVLENVKNWMCCLPVVVSCWLCCYINTADQERREKPLLMLEQLMTTSNKSDSSSQNDSRCQFMKTVIEHLSQEILPANHHLRNISKQYIPANEPPAIILEETLKLVFSKGWVDLKSLHTLEQVLNLCGSDRFCDQVVHHMLESNKVDDLCMAVSLVFALFHMDLEHLTLSLLVNTLPRILYSADNSHLMIDPRGYTLAKLVVLCITAAQVSKVGQKEPYVRRGRKRSRIDVDVEEMDECEVRPAKMRKINEPQLTLLSEDFNFDDMTVKEDGEHSPAFDTKEPLNKAIVNLFCLLNAIVHDKRVTARTGFIRSFIDEALKCGPQYYRFILQFMPSNMLPQLMKTMPGIFTNQQILHICDLSTLSGRKLAAKAVCHNSYLKVTS
ncbi:mediator of RNA polymerase II transcription subunit 24 isoform X3 [Patella vulgata]|uniref:mediator of RNA polymerase II transcription subunit 24 isoform X3 n=1 Tax=Patella vulgata TaxID=6465 RepID=UPI0021803B28|nr:mediator of RNA polymerase II transcription subunit 24 isoform X3 [Patella vulgata]